MNVCGMNVCIYVCMYECVFGVYERVYGCVCLHVFMSACAFLCIYLYVCV